LTNRIGVWPVPRQAGDEEILRQSTASPHRLKDFGYLARIGTYVDYRDKRKTYVNRPKHAKKNAVFPIIWSSDITSEGVVIHGRTSKEDSHHKFIAMERTNHPSVIRRPVIALQRVTSPDQPRRLVCASINEEFLELHGGVVGENHVILLEKISDTTQITTLEFASILSSKTIDRLFRCISGAVNVSVSELNQLALPNPTLISRYIHEGCDINAAVLRAFNMEYEPARILIAP
jgi:adenine-specific DNA-methyltransferase